MVVLNEKKNFKKYYHIIKILAQLITITSHYRNVLATYENFDLSPCEQYEFYELATCTRGVLDLSK
jgi:hypothetical protein